MSNKTWIYTLNNYTDADIEKLKLLEVNRHRCCKEVGETGTPHLQGCITFKRNYRLKQLHKLFPNIHWEIARAVDAVNYCIKGEVIIEVINNEQGKRSDLNEITDKIKAGASMRDIALEYPSQYIRYYKGFQAFQQTIAPCTESFEKVKVVVVYGDPGIGKTRYAYEHDPNLYNVAEPVNNTIWFDGYIGQKTILLDDFYAWVKYHYLLQLLDGYPMMLPVKGSFVRKNWNAVFITSNNHPSLWYNRPEWDALKRRITEIIEKKNVS